VREIQITGVGVASPYGLGRSAFWQGLAEGRSAIGPLTLFSTEGFRARIAAEIPADAALPGSSRRSRADRLAIAAADEAVADAGLDRATLRPAAVVVGGIGGGMLETEAWHWRRVREGVDDPRLRRTVRAVLPSAHAETLARRFGTTGPKQTVVLACSSGGAAIGVAADLIRAGEAPLALAGGVDALTRICFMGFNALKLLDPEPCRPFARDRRGMSLGEGAGFLILEDAEHAAARGVRPWGILAGHGLTTDAHHMTAPHPDAEGSVRAMVEALEDGHLPAAAVGYVNAHGTGTVQNDRAEALALRKVFGADGVLVSATKSLVGHTMAAAGALEAIATVLGLVHELLPPTAHLTEPDPEIPFDCLPLTARPARVECAMSNSFGFGGQNVSLLFRRAGHGRASDGT
jgi:3-oxoacyl-[acyl-carrier-protein] synthase II